MEEEYISLFSLQLKGILKLEYSSAKDNQLILQRVRLNQNQQEEQKENHPAIGEKLMFLRDKNVVIMQYTNEILFKGRK